MLEPVELARLALMVALGYLLGAVPSGVIVGRLRGVDPRALGSGRIGTTNALRTLGPAGAAVVLAMDVAKGAAAVLLALWLAGDGWPPVLAGVAAVIGHIRSVFIGWGGGRGVATGAGVMLVLEPLTVLVALPLFGLLLWRTRYVSLGSIAAVVVVAAVAAGMALTGPGRAPVLVAAVAIGGLVVAAHADNIGRLRAGTERRLGEPGATVPRG